MQERSKRYTSSPTKDYTVWMVWEVTGGVRDNVPLVQVFHGTMEACDGVADALNARYFADR